MPPTKSRRCKIYCYNVLALRRRGNKALSSTCHTMMYDAFDAAPYARLRASYIRKENKCMLVRRKRAVISRAQPPSASTPIAAATKIPLCSEMLFREAYHAVDFSFSCLLR